MQLSYWNCFWITLAGGIGSLSRFYLNEKVETWFGKAFPFGTMLVNMLGCLLFGVVWGSCAKGVMSAEMRLILLVGFMGGFTTFSSFAFHNEQMLMNRQWGYLLTNVLVQNIVGIVAIWVGIKLAELVLPPGVVPPVGDA
jgi:CrcB protein